MSNTLKFVERFAPRVQVRDASPVASGSPVRVSLTFRPGANTPEAARHLIRRHVPPRAAHAALTEMVDSGRAYVNVPKVEDLETLQRELLAVGIVARRHQADPVDVKLVRSATGLSQEAFSLRFGLDVATVRNWEQGRSRPDAAALALLWTIARHPDAVSYALDMDDPDVNRLTP